MMRKTKPYHVTYFYLASGMEGVADERDYGIINATCEEEAMDIVNIIQGGTGDEDKISRHWGLKAREVHEED